MGDGNGDGTWGSGSGRRLASSRVRRDLEEQGVSPEFSRLVAEVLADCGIEARGDGYEALLTGVTAAWSIYADELGAMESRRRDVAEIQQLMRGFAGELRKLEEGLRIVSAFAQRMYAKASEDPAGSVH